MADFREALSHGSTTASEDIKRVVNRHSSMLVKLTRTLNIYRANLASSPDASGLTYD